MPKVPPDVLAVVRIEPDGINSHPVGVVETVQLPQHEHQHASAEKVGLVVRPATPQCPAEAIRKRTFYDSNRGLNESEGLVKPVSFKRFASENHPRVDIEDVRLCCVSQHLLSLFTQSTLKHVERHLSRNHKLFRRIRREI
jgi:hypothetical protein